MMTAKTAITTSQTLGLLPLHRRSFHSFCNSPLRARAMTLMMNGMLSRIRKILYTTTMMAGFFSMLNS